MLNTIGKLKHYKSSEIDESYVSIGFECLDRELWNPDKCYDLLAESGVKHARVQTGWVRCEKDDVLLAYPTRPDLLGLEVGGIYTLDEVKRALTEAYAE